MNSKEQAADGIQQDQENTAAPETEAGFDKGSEGRTSGSPEDQAADASAEQEELAGLRRQADENYQRYLRTQADFDNFRRRSRQEKEEFAKYASAKLIEQLLPVVDNFERALASGRETKDIESILKGLEMTYRQIDQVLQQEGVVPMETVGQPFNPERHQAIMQVESADHEEGTIVEEIQKGYMLKDKVLRPAMVKVSG